MKFNLNSRSGRVALTTLLLSAVASTLVIPLVQAEAPQSRKFLAVQAIYSTNTANITNLNTAVSVGTNFVGTAFTNLGRLVVINTTSASTNVNASRINPLQDVALWSLDGGAPPWSTGSTNGSITYNQSYATLTVTMTGGAGADSAIPFVFTPVFNGVNEATETANEWTVGFTPTASTRTTLSTNVPLWRWPGAAKLRLRRIVNTDTTAAGHVIIEDISLNGFPP